MAIISTLKTIPAQEFWPLAFVSDGGVAVNKRGLFTLGWRLTFRTPGQLLDTDYDKMLETYDRAMSVLPAWTVVNRQDRYFKKRWSNAERPEDELLGCYLKTFEGREYLDHEAYIFVTLAERKHIDRSGSTSGLFGYGSVCKSYSAEAMETFVAKCAEFEAVLTSGGLIQASRLTKRDWLGEDDDPGLVQTYLMLGDTGSLMSDIGIARDGVSVLGKKTISYDLAESDAMSTEFYSIEAVDKYSTTKTNWYMSLGAAFGQQLNCEHVVNQIIVIPDKTVAMNELESRRKRMNSGFGSTDNRLNVTEIEEFQETSYRGGYLLCHSCLSIVAWGEENELISINSEICKALSKARLTVKRNLQNAPITWYAGCPACACDIGKNNLMEQDIYPVVALAAYEGYDNGPCKGQGNLIFADRFRHIPVRLSTTEEAQKQNIIVNFNAFMLGASGTGKSFTTNTYLHQQYVSGAEVFIIDAGGSYQGLCTLTNEQSGGKDGIYNTWDAGHPYRFAVFASCRDWVREDGSLNMDNDDANFIITLLTTMCDCTASGWSDDTLAILVNILETFIKYVKDNLAEDKVIIFDDFYQFVSSQVAPRINYHSPAEALVVSTVESANERANTIEEDKKKYGYWKGDRCVTTEDFSVDTFLSAIEPYALGKRFGAVLNNEKSDELFTSRFTVYDVDALTKSSDPKLYSLVILCMMNAFQAHMYKASGTKILAIDEAWQAIANQTMEGFIRKLWKVARKYSTSAMVITQELDDVLSSAVIKDTIIANSDVKILLDQSRQVDKFDGISAAMGLNNSDYVLALSMGKDNDSKFTGRDVFIKLGSTYSQVFRVEVSMEQMIVYESARKYKAAVNAYREHHGLSYIDTVKALADEARKMGSVIDVYRKYCSEYDIK